MPAWYSDPSGRFAFRFWDGSSWTEQVLDYSSLPYMDPPIFEPPSSETRKSQDSVIERNELVNDQPPRRGAPLLVRDDLIRAAGRADRFVIVDTETTGVYPSDRVVEICLVTLSKGGEVVDVFETLVNPNRDISNSHIHGVSASMVAGAPSFDEIASDVAQLIDGAVLVAHNLAFDARMLKSEFSRIGVQPNFGSGIDTLAATSLRLLDACEHFDIQLTGHHSARADAVATAELFVKVVGACGSGSPASVIAPTTPTGRRLTRSAVAGGGEIRETANRHRPANTGGELSASVVGYLELLERAVSDMHLDREERAYLSGLAEELGLSGSDIAAAHRRIVNEALDRVLLDGVVEDEEYETVVRLSAMLGVDRELVELRVRHHRQSVSVLALRAGMKVVFTGDHPEIPRDAGLRHAEVLGLEVQSGVTKQSNLVVAADRESRSGKAKKAHAYGVPVVSIEDFIQVEVGGSVEVAAASVGGIKVLTCPVCLVTWTVPSLSTERSARCADCRRGGDSAASSDSKVSPPASPDGDGIIEVLTCEQCARSWERVRVRGRKPRLCPNCL